MVAFNPFLPGDRTINVSDAPAMRSYPFSFEFDGLASAGSVNALQPSSFVPGTIGSTSMMLGPQMFLVGQPSVRTSRQRPPSLPKRHSRCSILEWREDSWPVWTLEPTKMCLVWLPVRLLSTRCNLLPQACSTPLVEHTKVYEHL